MAIIADGFLQYKESLQVFFADLEKEGDKLLNLAGIKMVATTRGLQDTNKNYATRRLNDLTNYKISGKVLTFGSNAKNKGYSYGLVQEFGRRKGKWPNIGDIEKWVKKKIMLGHIKLKNPEKLGNTRAKQLKTLAFLISRKIKNKGVKGRFYYKAGFESGLKLFNSNINEFIQRAFNG